MYTCIYLYLYVCVYIYIYIYIYIYVSRGLHRRREVDVGRQPGGDGGDSAFTNIIIIIIIDIICRLLVISGKFLNHFRGRLCVYCYHH